VVSTWASKGSNISDYVCYVLKTDRTDSGDFKDLPEWHKDIHTAHASGRSRNAYGNREYAVSSKAYGRSTIGMGRFYDSSMAGNPSAFQPY